VTVRDPNERILRSRVEAARARAAAGQAPTSPGVCAHCGQNVVWGTTARGRRVPLNPAASRGHRGNFVFAAGVAVYILDSRREQLRADGVDNYESHFASCVAGERARRRRDRGDDT
jgi:hypothetical protein